MEERDVTSEERLLKLIRKKNPGSGSVALEEPHGETPSTAVFGAEELKKVRLPVGFLKIINLVLLVLCIGLLGSFIYRYLQLKNAVLVSTAALSVKTKEDSVLLEASAKTIKPFEVYAKDIDSRDLFLSPWEKENPGDSAATGLGIDLGKDLKLVGIVLDKDPKAIIEDLRSNQTIFLSKGERIGEAVVSEIREDKVILIYNEEKVELKP